MTGPRPVTDRTLMIVCTPIQEATPEDTATTNRSEVPRATRIMPHTSSPRHTRTARVPNKPNSSPTIAKIKSVCAACR